MEMIIIENKIRVDGKQNFMNMEIPVVLGGFGEGKKCISDKTIAGIHNVKVFHVRELINKNIKRFKEMVDFIDLNERIGDGDTLELLRNLGYSKQSATQAKHIYVLSERGYAKLIKIMDSDLAWEVHDKLIDEYFTMRETIQNIISEKDKVALSIIHAKDDISRAVAISKYEEMVTKPLIEAIQEQKPLVDFANTVSKAENTIDMGKMSKVLQEKNKIEIGRNRLFEFLRSKKILMGDNTPYQKYIERNWFKVIETVKETAYDTRVFTKVLVTGTGQLKIADLVIAEFQNGLTVQ